MDMTRMEDVNVDVDGRMGGCGYAWRIEEGERVSE